MVACGSLRHFVRNYGNCPVPTMWMHRSEIASKADRSLLQSFFSPRLARWVVREARRPLDKLTPGIDV
jgi:hypothetical protein